MENGINQDLVNDVYAVNDMNKSKSAKFISEIKKK